MEIKNIEVYKYFGMLGFLVKILNWFAQKRNLFGELEMVPSAHRNIFEKNFGGVLKNRNPLNRTICLVRVGKRYHQ